MNSSTRTKTTLFCSVCGHESPPDGDWDESETTTELGQRLTLSCPDCGTTWIRRNGFRASVEVELDGMCDCGREIDVVADSDI